MEGASFRLAVRTGDSRHPSGSALYSSYSPCLAKDLAKRPADAHAFQTALRSCRDAHAWSEEDARAWFEAHAQSRRTRHGQISRRGGW